MKLTELAIDNFGVCKKLRLNRFSNGLNIIYGASGTGKTTLQRYIQNVLFGFTKDHHDCTGNLIFHNGHELTRLSRRAEFNTHLILDNETDPPQPSHSIEAFLNQTGTTFFDTIYHVNSAKSCTSINQIIQQLRERFNVSTGKPTRRQQPHPFSFYNHYKTPDEDQKLILHEIKTLNRERSLLLSQAKLKSSIDISPRVELELETDRLSRKIAEYDLSALRQSIATTDSKVTELRAELEAAKEEPQTTKNTEIRHLLETLCSHLDDLNQQIRGSHKLQDCVQQRRLRLRDEMTIWNDLEFNTPQHPYYEVGRLISSLNEHLKRIKTPPSLETNLSSSEHFEDGCDEMRKDLHSLQKEIGLKYQNLRHHAAAVELKQLRIQYTQISANLGQLLNRRQEISAKIQNLVELHGRAIALADSAHLQNTVTENYQGDQSHYYSSAPTNTFVSPADSALQNRLNELQSQRKQLVLRLVEYENCLRPLETQLQHLQEQRARIDWDSQQQLDTQFVRLENQLAQLNHKKDALSKLRKESAPTTLCPDPLLHRAGQLAGQLTLGEVTEIWLHESQDGKHFQLVTEGEHQDSIPFQTLSSMTQQQVSLSLCLAAVEEMNRQGIALPMLLDDFWKELDPARVKMTFELLNHYCRQGIQILATTSDRSIASRARDAGIRLHELPESVNAQNQKGRRGDHFYSTSFNTGNSVYADNHAISHTTAFADLSTPITYPLANYKPNTANRASKTPISKQNVADTSFASEGNSPMLKAKTPSESSVLEFAPLVDESTPLINFDLFTPSNAASLLDCGIETIEDLLTQNTKELTPALSQQGFTTSDLESWQSTVWLMICVPGLRMEDARLLRSIGIAEPEQLYNTTSVNLTDRLHRFLSQNKDMSFQWRPDDYSSERINRWYRALDRTQKRWQTTTGYSRQTRAKSNNLNTETDAPSHSKKTEAKGPRTQLPTNHHSSNNRPAKRRRSTKTKKSKELSIAATFADRKKNKKTNAKTAQQPPATKPLRFHLDLQDHIEAAPSIGAKTAERFQKIGIDTIGEFLKNSAKSMAKKIDSKRISTKTIQTWQQQTELVFRTPNLRGHDARILVACGITEPEMLNSMTAQELFDIVSPFSETKQGLKIIRTGKKPDIQEINNWIQWSGETRTRKAA